MNRFPSNTKRLGIVAALVLVMMAFAAPGGVFAHAKLASSSPADGATIAPGLTTITLTLTEETSVDQSTSQLLHADGSPVAGATGAVDRADRKKITIITPALAEGKYLVKWHTVTEDDNGIADGSFGFTVGAQASTQGGSQSSINSGSSSESLPQAGEAQTLVTLGWLAVCAFALAAAGLALRGRVTR
jgi:methionine-rich copper-binding protein CopC